MAEPRGAAGRRGSTTRGAFALRSSAARCARVGFGLAIALLACARPCVAAVADPTGRDRCDAPIDGTGVVATDRPATCDAGDAVAADAGDRRLTGVSTTAEFLRDRYVVRFDDYRPIEAHYDALVRALGPPLNADDGVMGEPSTDDTPDDDDVGESGSTAPPTAPPTAPRVKTDASSPSSPSPTASGRRATGSTPRSSWRVPTRPFERWRRRWPWRPRR